MNTVVVPCFNEARRLHGDGLLSILDHGADHLIFVDDGSTDATLELLQGLKARAGARVTVHPLARNGGKGNAVRAGLVRALDEGAKVVGYWDADLATPAAGMGRVLAALQEPGIDVAMGSRVALLGRTIERSAHRHYLGRVFATSASLALGLRVYDTQCGAKAFRDTGALRRALASPFRSRFAFDVELLARLLDDGVAPRALVEVPLDAWRDVGGSSLSPRAMAQAGLDLAQLAVSRRRRQLAKGGRVL